MMRRSRVATSTLRLVLPAQATSGTVAFLAAPVQRSGGAAWLEAGVLVLRGPVRVIDRYAVTLGRLLDSAVTE